ncbi:MAG: glycyl-radical enzyme activating protein [Bacillota bacterium]|nr:glycyl-radical enzyme activating protein [Bacillota bacterium]
MSETGKEAATAMQKGRVYDIQRFSVHDGPGVRTEIFLFGCPLECLWCHSPESQSFNPQLAWYEIRCIGTAACGVCLAACPQKAISPGPTKVSPADNVEIQLIETNRKLCDNCGECTRACPSGALEMTNREMTLEEVMEIIERDRRYYSRSGGGVTISGGEPMVQYEFTLALLKECKKRGLHTCLDTTGYSMWSYYEKILPYVDLFLYDLKHMDSDSSVKLTGVPNELILENARKLARAGAALQVRVPIIPGFNDDEENLRETGMFCRELGPAVVLVQILPYHGLGAAKYERLGRKYELTTIEAPSEERMEEIKSFLETFGLQVKIH